MALNSVTSRISGKGARASRPAKPSMLRPQVTVQRSVAAYAEKMPQWDVMWEVLMDNKVKSLSPMECMDLVNSGDWILVDVRPKEVFEKASPAGAVNVPLFQNTDFSQATPASLLKAAAYMFNGVSPVEPNPKFSEQMKEVTNGKKPILMCEAGGTMKPSANFMRGKTSRSLKAAYRTLQEGLAEQVAHLDGGVYGWYLSNSPMRGEYDTSNVGRTPNAAAEPTGFLVNEEAKK